jgi:predicted DCC family thiol-disulfide oxidoreductase YuxK
MKPPDAEAEMTVCYNGACPVCRASMKHYSGVARRHELPLGWDDITTAPDLFERHGIGFDQALRRLYAVDRDGRLLCGIDVFIAIWRRLPGRRWLAAVTAFPAIRPVAWFVYEYLVSYPIYRWSRRRLRRRAARAAP